MGNGGTAPHILNVDTRWKWVVSFNGVRPGKTIHLLFGQEGQLDTGGGGVDPLEETDTSCSFRERDQDSLRVQRIA
jgi:hypothetical protein